MVLIYPPMARISEPPVGLSQISGALNYNNIPHILIDCAYEGIMWLLSTSIKAEDTWTKRAYKKLDKDLLSLTTKKGFSNLDSYKQAVSNINRILSKVVITHEITLTNYADKNLSPLSTNDLLKSAKEFKENPFYGYFKKRLMPLADTENVFGFSINYLGQGLCAFAMIGFLKSIRRDIKIIIGGSLITSWDSLYNLSDKFGDILDEIIPGNGEQELIKTEERPNAVFSSIYNEMPDYDQFMANSYFAPGLILPVNTSTGCRWRQCTFCPEKYERRKYYQKPIKEQLVFLQKLVKKYNPVLIHFTDNELSPLFLKEITKIPPGVEWYGFSRFISLLKSEDFCHLLKKSGCKMLKLGLESGDQIVIDKLKKGIDLNDAAIILKNLKHAGIGTFIYILFGTPSEDYKSAVKTKEFLIEYSSFIDFLNIAIFNMPLLSPEVNQYKASSFYEADLSLYTEFSHPKKWNRDIIRKFINSELKQCPEIKKILNTTPPVFTSSHAPFFL